MNNIIFRVLFGLFAVVNILVAIQIERVTPLYPEPIPIYEITE